MQELISRRYISVTGLLTGVYFFKFSHFTSTFVVRWIICRNSSTNKGNIILITRHDYVQESHTQIKIICKGNMLLMYQYGHLNTMGYNLSIQIGKNRSIVYIINQSQRILIKY